MIMSDMVRHAQRFEKVSRRNAQSKGEGGHCDVFRSTSGNLTVLGGRPLSAEVNVSFREWASTRQHSGPRDRLFELTPSVREASDGTARVQDQPLKNVQSQL